MPVLFETHMGSLADAAGKFAEKIADVLDVFDLSFFVAGSAALGALLIWLKQQGIDIPDGLSTDRALVAVIIAYVLGLISYTLGRSARDLLQDFVPRLLGKGDPKAHKLDALFKHHHLGEVADFEQYHGGNSWSALYDRLWVLVRTEASLRETYILVRRYWVLGAAYDGLAVAALLWLLPVSSLELSAQELPETSLLGVKALLSAGLVLGALMSLRQAKEYHGYQIRELAATAAHWSKVGDGPAPGETKHTAVEVGASDHEAAVDEALEAGHGIGVDAES